MLSFEALKLVSQLGWRVAASHMLTVHAVVVGAQQLPHVHMHMSVNIILSANINLRVHVSMPANNTSQHLA